MILSDIDKFKKWLQQNGCEILVPTNQYEEVRFRGSEIGVLYYTGKTSNGYTSDAIRHFKNGKKWDGGIVSTGRHNSYIKQKKLLLKRDGKDCFYCGLPLDNDITLEHLIPLNQSGPNTLSNMVLAHEKCNQKMGSKNINKKVSYAIEQRKLNQ